MLTARNEAPVRLLTAAEVRRSGSVRIGAGTGVGRATAVETVCIAPSTARMAVPSKTVRRCCNIENPNCPVFRCGHPGGQGLTPDVGDVRNFRAVLWIADSAGFRARIAHSLAAVTGLPGIQSWWREIQVP